MKNPNDVHVSKVTMNPVSQMTGEEFKQYSQAISTMDFSNLNINTCNKERKTEEPYVSYKLVKPHDIYGSNAEFRVLKFWQSPKALKVLNQDNNSRIFTAVKSDATYGSWELGDMYFRDLARLIHEGYVVEHKRSIEFSLYEWRMSVYHMSLSSGMSEEDAFNEYKSDINGVLKAMKDKGMDYEHVVKCVVNADSDETKPFYFNQRVAEDLDFLSQSFKNSHSDEVKTILNFINSVICNYKGKHLEKLEKQGIEVTPSKMRQLAEPWDIIDAMDEELKLLKKAVSMLPRHMAKDENVGQA